MLGSNQKILFWGTPATAADCLKLLLKKNKNVIAVVTQPDKPVGRKHILTNPPVKVVAEEAGLPILQPETLKCPGIVEKIKNLQPEICVVVAYGKILPSEILNIPENFINLHFSLLPEYRGAAPVQKVIIDGKSETGVTVQHVVKELDKGDIILQKKLGIDTEDTTESLLEKAVEIGAPLLCKAIELITSGKAPRIPQNDDDATYALKITKEDGYIDWSRSAKDIHNQIRGCYPWPTSHTKLNGKLFKILKSKVSDNELLNLAPGAISATKKQLFVSTGEGVLEILEIQPPGKKRMTAQAFLAGHNLVGNQFLTI